MSEIRVGQVYASSHSGDIEREERQRRMVTRIDGCFVWLKTEGGKRTSPESRVRLRADASRCRTIPGHRLVEDVSS